MAELFKVLEMLDRASLAEQRRLTIPFVKQILIL
jgi:chromosomal replication initiation ATPase DnaA